MKEGDFVFVKSACLDNLTQAFGDEGDGDFWDRSEWRVQKKYIGKRGVVEQLEPTPYGTFGVVQFPDGEMFTFDAYDLEVVASEDTDR